MYKGALWVGRQNLGRFWSIGPQYTLYVPGCWLTRGENQITFFDIQAKASEKIGSVSAPVFGKTKATREVQ